MKRSNVFFCTGRRICLSFSYNKSRSLNAKLVVSLVEYYCMIDCHYFLGLGLYSTWDQFIRPTFSRSLLELKNLHILLYVIYKHTMIYFPYIV